MPHPNFYNPADQYVGKPGHWTPDLEHAARFGYNLRCVHCGDTYNNHNPWPTLPCPAKKVFDVFCGECKQEYEQTEYHRPTRCGLCGSDFVAVRIARERTS